jgi:hypothetical protein
MTKTEKIKISRCKKVLFLLYPPYKAYISNKFIEEDILEDKYSESSRSSKRFEDIFNKTIDEIDSIESEKDLSLLLAEAERVQASEKLRKDTIEGKAASLASNSGLITAILSIIPAIPNTPMTSNNPLIMIYFIALLHLIVSVYYAMKARGIGNYSAPSADSFNKIIGDKKHSIINSKIALCFTQVKWSEPYITMRINLLVTAELLALRGLAFIGVAAIITIYTSL